MTDKLYKRIGWARRAAVRAGRQWIAVEHPHRAGYFVRRMTAEEQSRHDLLRSLNETMMRVVGKAITEEVTRLPAIMRLF